MSSGARPIDETISDAKVRDATGRSREEWFALLDEVGAQEWDHTRIARWLGGEHSIDGWWAQGVTVAYEQSRGLREPGQRRDGGWEANASKTLYVSPQNLWPYLADEDERARWLDVDWKLIGLTEHISVRLHADDGSKVTLRIDVLKPGVDGRQKLRLGVQHVGLRSGDDIPETKAFWKAAFAQLADQLSVT